MRAHLTDAEVREFSAGTLSPDALLRGDDHLGECDRCRQRAADLGGAGRGVADFEGLIAASPHLSEEALQSYVERRLMPAAERETARHLEECSVCATEVNALTAWARAGSRAHPSWLAIAALVILAIFIPAAVRQMRPAKPTARASAVSGLDALVPADQARVRAALEAGVAMLPADVADLAGSREVLLGPPTRGDTFEVTAPVATVTLTDRPQFEWRALPGADGYIVTVFDERSNMVVQSPNVTAPRWTPAEPLARGITYVWQITARRGRDAITAPAAPAPAARFRVVDAQTAADLQRAAHARPDAHLALGILYTQAGLRDEARTELQQVPAIDPHADVARRTLQGLNR